MPEREGLIGRPAFNPPTMRILILLAPLLVGLSSFAGEPQTVRLLAIGNSFTRNATNHLDDLAQAGGHTLILNPLIIGGSSLQRHAEKAQKNEADPEDESGLYSNGRGLKDNLTADAWDFVTIQQVSMQSHDRGTYQPHAGWLRDFIAKHAPTAKLLVHQTWAYRKDDPRFTKPSDDPGEPTTQEQMYRGLTEAYDAIATELGGRVIPVGDAFYAADTDPAWGYQVPESSDTNTLQPPALPAQPHSLHVGWFWRKLNAQDAGKDNQPPTLVMDGHHANLAGEYLGACVWYEVLFAESPVGLTHIPKGLDADYARFLQETAHRAVTARGD